MALTITHNVLRIAAEFIRQKPQKLSPYAISKKIGVPYNITWEGLGRMEAEGWLSSEMERVNPISIKPRRRLYRLTTAGEAESIRLLQALQVPGIGTSN